MSVVILGFLLSSKAALYCSSILFLLNVDLVVIPILKDHTFHPGRAPKNLFYICYVLPGEGRSNRNKGDVAHRSEFKGIELCEANGCLFRQTGQRQ